MVDFFTRSWDKYGALSRRLAGHAITLAVSAYIFWLFNKRFLYSGFGYDEQFFVWGGWSITKGLAPYRDFLEYKPPFIFLTHALAYKLFGLGIGGIKYFFAYFPMLSILALHASMLSRGINRILALALVVAMIQLFVNPRYHDSALTDTESIGLCYYFLAVACLLAQTSIPRFMASLGGIFMTCCVFSKEPFLPCALTTWSSILLLEGSTGTRLRPRQYALYTALGAGIVLLGLCIYMIPTGSMKAYLAMATRYAKVYRDPAQSYCVVLGRFHPTTPLNDLKVQFHQARDDFLNASTLGFVAPFFVASCVFIWRRSVVLFLASLTGVAAALWAVTASNCQWIHYYNMAMSGLFFFLVLGLDSMSGVLDLAARSMRAWACAVPALCVALIVGPRVDDDLNAKYAFQPLETTLLIEKQVPGVVDTIERETTPNDRILTTGAPGLYVVTNRLPAARESTWTDEIIAIYPGETDAERFRPIYEELVRNMPKVVVLDPQFASRMTRHMANVVTPFLENFDYKKLNDHIYLRP